MAFKKSTKPTFVNRVKVLMPNSKGGHDVNQFDGIFKLVANDKEMEKLREMTPKDSIREVLTGWNEFQEEDGTPVPFNEAEVEALLSIPQALHGLLLAFFENVVKAPEKNSR